MKGLAEAIHAEAREGTLPCARATALAARLGVRPLFVGKEASRLSVKISHCELGLFGHPVAGKGRIVTAAAAVPEGLEKAIGSRLIGGRLPCRAAWEIAEEHGLPKLVVSSAAEALGVRISACSLGCFP